LAAPAHLDGHRPRDLFHLWPSPLGPAAPGGGIGLSRPPGVSKTQAAKRGAGTPSPFLICLDGWEPETGKHLWRRYTTAGKGEPGGDSWPGDTAEHGGAPTWLTGSYDPDLDLVYWGTGNGGPWNPNARKGDNLYICSALAVRPKTGEIIWHYQFSPNDG